MCNRSFWLTSVVWCFKWSTVLACLSFEAATLAVCYDDILHVPEETQCLDGVAMVTTIILLCLIITAWDPTFSICVYIWCHFMIWGEFLNLACIASKFNGCVSYCKSPRPPLPPNKNINKNKSIVSMPMLCKFIWIRELSIHTGWKMQPNNSIWRLLRWGEWW